jgi:hypothetical protein
MTDEIHIATGRLTGEVFMGQIILRIDCASDEEAQLSFDALLEMWHKTGKLTLSGTLRPSENHKSSEHE